jgi:hypothetical protein
MDLQDVCDLAFPLPSSLGWILTFSFQTVRFLFSDPHLTAVPPSLS